MDCNCFDYISRYQIKKVSISSSTLSAWSKLVWLKNAFLVIFINAITCYTDSNDT